MTIIERTGLSFEGHFVQVPNAWARDSRLTRKARGILIEILSHSRGWEVSEAALIKSGSEGRDAIRTGLTELVELGYLERAQTRDGDGTFAEARLELADPWANTQMRTVDGFSVDGSTVVGLSVAGKSAPIRTSIPKNTNSQEHHDASAHSFEDWWKAYPLKKDKGRARTAYQAALKKTSVEVLLAAAVAYRGDPNRDPNFTKYPASWLNAEAWENGPLESRGAQRQGAVEQMVQAMRNRPLEGGDLRELGA